MQAWGENTGFGRFGHPVGGSQREARRGRLCELHDSLMSQTRIQRFSLKTERKMLLLVGTQMVANGHSNFRLMHPDACFGVRKLHNNTGIRYQSLACEKVPFHGTVITMHH